MRSQIQDGQQFIESQFVVRGDALQNAVQRAELQRTVRRDRFVMLAITLGGKPDVRTFLACHDIIQ